MPQIERRPTNRTLSDLHHVHLDFDCMPMEIDESTSNDPNVGKKRKANKNQKKNLPQCNVARKTSLPCRKPIVLVIHCLIECLVLRIWEEIGACRRISVGTIRIWCIGLVGNDADSTRSRGARTTSGETGLAFWRRRIEISFDIGDRDDGLFRRRTRWP